MLVHYALSAVTLLSVVSARPPSYETTFNWEQTKYLIAFGDSYTYVQGTHGRQNYSFIGDAFNPGFTRSELLSNRIVQNQTATAEGGPNWVEYLTGCGLRPGLTDPRTCSKQLWDFAFAGSDISTEYTPLHHNFTLSLVNQTRQFCEYAEPVLQTFVEKDKALVAFWIGINDIGDSDKYDVDFYAFYNQLMDTLFAAVQNVYDLGYRKFLFMNLPPLNRTPGNVARAAGPLPNVTMVDWYNQALYNHSVAFRESNRGAWAKVFDANTFLNGVMDHHTHYGISNITGYCASYDQPFINTDSAHYGCLPLPEYFWFNTGHMTSHVHRLLAGAVGDYLKTQT